MMKVIATIASSALGAVLSMLVWYYGKYKGLKGIKNPYSGNIFAFLLLGAVIGAMIMIFWFLNDDRKN